MHPVRTAEKANPRAVAAYLLIAVAFLVVCFTWGRARLFWGAFFWDARVYARAIATWRAGGDPYLFDPAALPFANPPLFLKSVVWLSYLFPGHLGWYVYLAALIAATFAIPWLLARFYVRSEWMTPVVALAVFALQPRFMVERMMMSGNVATLLYAPILISGIPGLRRNRWALFYLTITLAAVAKPAFLALLILPLLAGSRQLLQSAVTAVCVFAVYILQRLTMPRLFLAFRDALYVQLVEKHDAGAGMYGHFLELGGRVALVRGPVRASIAHFAVVAILAGALFLLRKGRDLPAVEKLWVPALIVMAILADPRLQDYDIDIAVVPAVYVCAECARQAMRSARGIGAVVIWLTVLVAVYATDPSIGVCLLLLMAIVLPLVRLAKARSSTAPVEAAEQAAGVAPLREIA
jgi:hypothetical protein